MVPFCYKPLTGGENAFRLLIVRPGYVDDPLHCSLSNLTIASAPPYDALSYVWGDSIASHDITVDDCQFLVKPNVAAALRSARYVSMPRPMWVDAICIDQANNAERSSQVQIMRQIFANAATVLIWLGEEEEETRKAFDFINDYTSLLGHQAATTLDDNASRDLQTRWALENIANDILGRVWWRRVWVIQEVTVSKRATLRCGTRSVRWLEFVSVLNGLSQRGGTFELNKIRTMRKSLDLIEEMRRAWVLQYRLDLVSLLLMSTDFEATDPRDKVFALLGLEQTKADAPVFLPDYGKDVLTVYKDVVQYCIDTYASLDTICAAGLDSEQSRRYLDTRLLPSWLPDWTRRQPAWRDVQDSESSYINLVSYPVSSINKAMPTPFKAAATTRPRAHFESLNSTRELLIVQGICVDVLETVSMSNFTANLLQRLEEWEGLLRRHFGVGDLFQNVTDHWKERFRRARFINLQGSFQTLFDSDSGGSRGMNEEKNSLVLTYDILESLGVVEPRDHFSEWLVGTFDDLSLRESTNSKEDQSLNSHVFQAPSTQDRFPDSNCSPSEARASQTMPTYPSGCTLMEAYYRTLFVDSTASRWRASQLHIEACMKDPRIASKPEIVPPDFEPTARTEVRYDAFVRDITTSLESATQFRTLLISKESYIGLGPETMRQGDLICLLLGCRVPVILRRQSDGCCVLVGECYVHGIMDGEAMLGDWEERLETFRLY
jgi:hypothetical protein